MQQPVFFDAIKRSLFGGKLTDEQLGGLKAILLAWTAHGSGDRRHLAYVLATAFHETGTRMIPVREGQAQRSLWSDKQARNAVALLFKKKKISRNYALPGSFGNSFYGRGLAQITFEDNYRKMGKLVGVDLVRYPDEALKPDVAAFILIEGSLRGVSLKGDFSGKALEDYIHDDVCDFVHARQVINRMDRAADVANYAVKFDVALESAACEHTPFSIKKGTTRKAPAPQEKEVAFAVPDEKTLRDIQSRLRDLGYHDVGTPDGHWGNKTQGAVLAFRNENGLPTVPVIDDQFKAALWSATPREVGDARASAKLKDLKGVAPGATEAHYLKQAAGFLGVPTMAAGATLKTDDITGITSKVQAVKDLAALLPSPSVLILIGVAAVAVYFIATRVGAKIVRGYREGSVA
jgi:hypothetical protein